MSLAAPRSRFREFWGESASSSPGPRNELRNHGWNLDLILMSGAGLAQLSNSPPVQNFPEMNCSYNYFKRGSFETEGKSDPLPGRNGYHKRNWKTHLTSFVSWNLQHFSSNLQYFRKEEDKKEESNLFSFDVGLVACLGACVLSGFSGVWFEKVSFSEIVSVSVWLQSVLV